MKNLSIQLEVLTCPSCIKKIESAVGALNGVSEAKVMFNSSKVKVQFDEGLVDEEKIKKTITNLGYEILN